MNPLRFFPALVLLVPLLATGLCGCAGERRDCYESDDAVACERLCDTGDIRACLFTGQRFTADGPEKDPERGRQAFDKACKQGTATEGHPAITLTAIAEACYEVGLRYDDGTPSGLIQAMVHFGFACERGSGEACVKRGKAFEQGRGAPRSTERAYDSYLEGCAQGSAQACEHAQRVAAGAGPTSEANAGAEPR